MPHSVLVAIGGVVGCLCRFWLSVWVQNATGGVFPTGTLTVNIIGSFILGLVMTLAIVRELLSPELRIMLSVGFCGGFTTMSSFSYETLLLLESGYTGTALLNIALSIVACLTAVWLGSLAGRVF